VRFAGAVGDEVPLDQTVGDEVLLDTEHAPLPPRSLLSPRWMGPFKVLACPAPNTYRLSPESMSRRRRGASSPNSKSNVCAPTCAAARVRRSGPARCRRGPGGAGGAGAAAQVPDALRPPARAGALGGPRRIIRVRGHVGVAGAAGLTNCEASQATSPQAHRLRTSYRPRAALPRTAASRPRRAAAAASADRFHRRRGSAG
jgi:hypothetical protein